MKNRSICLGSLVSQPYETSEVEGLKILDELWECLGRVRAMSFVARSSKPDGWNGMGKGTVVVQRGDERTMTFTESGVWRPEAGRDIHFRNVFRWTVVRDMICLEHLRFGEDHPVYLFDLFPLDEVEWRSVSPHRCVEDCYSAVMLVQDNHIVLRWSIEGPRKLEEIEYIYSFQEVTS